jgi:hypothetical protein
MTTPLFMDLFNDGDSLGIPDDDYVIRILSAFLEKAENYWGSGYENIPHSITTLAQIEAHNKRAAELLRSAIQKLKRR